MILFGVDCLDEHLDLLMGRVALLTAPSGRTARKLCIIAASAVIIN